MLRETRYADKLVQRSPNLSSPALNEWGYSFLFAVGGVVIVLAFLVTLNFLSVQSIKLVLLPGTATGMAILLGGAYSLHLTRKIEGRNLQAGILRKLMV